MPQHYKNCAKYRYRFSWVREAKGHNSPSPMLIRGYSIFFPEREECTCKLKNAFLAFL